MNISFITRTIASVGYSLWWLVNKNGLLVDRGERTEGVILDSSHDQMKWRIRRAAWTLDFTYSKVKVHEITYEYKVDGQRLTAAQEGSDWLGLGLKTGDMVTISYLPWRPSRCRLYRKIYKDSNLI